MVPNIKLQVPEGESKILLHSCCAPCSSAILEALLNNGITPVIYYYNPNIYPQEEYEIRKAENKRYAESLGVEFIDGDYNYEKWRECAIGLESEPERGGRCYKCFVKRLTSSAEMASKLGIKVITTTLASSRWKDFNQIIAAGRAACEAIPNVVFWEQNWRKGGLYDRRNELLKELKFYNQQYCGCEFSKGKL